MDQGLKKETIDRECRCYGGQKMQNGKNLQQQQMLTIFALFPLFDLVTYHVTDLQ